MQPYPQPVVKRPSIEQNPRTLSCSTGWACARAARFRHTGPLTGPSWPGFARIARATIAALVLMPGAVAAQEVTEPALKAAFIYNFAKFTVWPADAVKGSEPFVMCVLGDPAVGGALERGVKGRVLQGHGMAVSQAGLPGSQRVCHVLYVSGQTAEEAAQLIAGLRDAPVLTISDAEEFTERGGIAQLFFDRGQLRFNVHVASARRARLQISSRLLALARQP